MAESPSHDSSQIPSGTHAGLLRRDVFLAERLPAYLAAGRHSLVLFECEASTWQAADLTFGHLVGEAFIAELILRLRSGLARADEWSALGTFTLATMLAGDDFADQVRAVRECVMQASQPIVLKVPSGKSPTEVGTPRVMAAVTIVAEPSQMSPAELIYQAARFPFEPMSEYYKRDGVMAWIHEQGSWEPFVLWSRKKTQAGEPRPLKP